MGVSSPTQPEGRPLRADARRNRERVLTAAREAFAKRGLETQIPDVAREAGVGVGTVYRHFPTKEALVDALVVARFEQFAERAAEALTALDEDADAWEAFAGFVRACAEVQIADRALSEVLGSQPEQNRRCIARERTDLGRNVDVLVGRCLAAGALRRDATPQDVPIVMTGLGGVVACLGDGAPQRYVELLLDALRAPRA